ncbi:unnamed protein product [Musa acuminata subsp. burmannicoides]
MILVYGVFEDSALLKEICQKPASEFFILSKKSRIAANILPFLLTVTSMSLLLLQCSLFQSWYGDRGKHREKYTDNRWVQFRMARAHLGCVPHTASNGRWPSIIPRWPFPATHNHTVGLYLQPCSCSTTSDSSLSTCSSYKAKSKTLLFQVALLKVPYVLSRRRTTSGCRH